MRLAQQGPARGDTTLCPVLPAAQSISAELGLTPRPRGCRSQPGWGEHSKALLVLLAVRGRCSDWAACPHHARELLTQTQMIWGKKWLCTSGILCTPGALPSISWLMYHCGHPSWPPVNREGVSGLAGSAVQPTGRERAPPKSLWLSHPVSLMNGPAPQALSACKGQLQRLLQGVKPAAGGSAGENLCFGFSFVEGRQKCRGVRQEMTGPLLGVGREAAAQHPARGCGTRCPQPGCPTPPAHGAGGGACPSGWDLGRLCRRSYKGADFPTDASIAALRKCVSRAGPPASRCFGERAGTAHTVFNN